MKETYKIEENRNSTKNLQVHAFNLPKVLHTPFGKNDMLYYYSKLAPYDLTSFD